MSATLSVVRPERSPIDVPVRRQSADALPSGIEDPVDVRTASFIPGPRPDHKPPSDGKGLAVIVIDGLSYPILKQVLQAGVMPNLQKFLDDEGYESHNFFPGLPATTPACMTGFNWGHNPIPSYHWYSKAEGRHYSADQLSDFEPGYEGPARAGGNTSLVSKGAIHSCLASGDAPEARFSVDQLSKAWYQGGIKAALKMAVKDVGNFAVHHPLRFLGTLGRFASQTWVNFTEGRNGRNPEVGSGPVLKSLGKAASGALETVLCTRAGADGVADSMKKGTPVIFIDFPSYDSTSHTYGPTSPETRDALRTIDKNLARILKQSRSGDRQYELAFVSDHGQTPSVNFSRLHGATLKDTVLGYINNPDEPIEEGGCGSMNHLYFTADQKQLTTSDLEGRYPGLIGKLAQHPGLDFVMTRDGATTRIFGHGGHVVVRDGQADFHGANILAGKGADSAIVAQQMHRVAQMPNSGDVVVFGRDLGEQTVTFVDKPGEHGGLGGGQNRAFFLSSPERDLSTQNVANTSDMYWIFRSMTPEDGR